MKKYKEYRYIGINGIITSRVKLDGVKYTPMLHIEADPGFILTNDEITTKTITIEAEDLPQWREVVDNTKKDN